MMNHEYALLGGMSRAKVGRYLSLIAAAVSAGIVFLLLSAVDIAKKYGIPAHVMPTVLSLVSAGTVFAALYWILDRFAWRWSWIGKLLNVPNISGEWDCKGQTIERDGSPNYQWTGKITIVQTWDKIRVRLKTTQSGSNSNSAALICDDTDGYRLFFSYKNDPRIEETELKSHRGFAEIVFDKNLKKGDGEYFNGHGRFTFGTMQLTRS